MRVLVTGSSGFVGGWLVRHLEDVGDEVVALPDELDIADRPALAERVVAARADGICHLAAQASVAASWDDPVGTFTTNAVGTLNLLDAAAACDVPPRVLLVGSAEIYGLVGAAELPVREERPFAPVNPYAASKAAAELIGLQAWLGRGLEVVRARPFNHTGPGQRADFVVPSLARQVVEAKRSRARSLVVGNVEVRRDITDVRDVVRAYRMLLEGGTGGEAYNVCSGRSLTIAEVARRLLALEGLDLPLEVDPARLRPADLPDLRGDPSRLQAATGWAPQVSLDQTLADVLTHWHAASDAPQH